ncbi:MAG: DsbA family protein [Pseudomonadota bacterium]
MTTTRREIIALAAAASGMAALAAHPAIAQDAEEADAAAPEAPKTYALGDIALGDENAPVTLFEYVSYSCPACRAFHERVFPSLKEEYIDTGKVRLIQRDFIRNRYDLWAAMLARCGGERGYYPITDALFKRQDVWARAQDPTEELMKIGRANGLSPAMMRECLSDQDFARAVVTEYQTNRETDGVEATPSFVLDGQTYRGALPFDELSELLEEALAS